MKKYLILLFVLFGPHITYGQTASETTVRDYFSDIPVMIEIARCESNFRQFTENGDVVRGGSGGGMVGMFQFFESIHTPAAANLGYDILTLDGNMAYAKYLYRTEGTTPWDNAKDCWKVATTTSQFDPNQEQAILTELKRQLALLQQLFTLLQKLESLR